MQNRKLEIGVGVFVIAGIVALLLLALNVSGLILGSSNGTYKVYANFDNIAGLTTHSKVSVAGVTIGKVTDISLDTRSYTAKVTMELDKSFDHLPTDSTASIITAGLLGEKYVGLSVGGDEETLSDGDQIDDTQSALVLEELISKFLLGSVNKDDTGSSEKTGSENQ
ncbi:UNVERIFIED_CONTAM: hypothetical protein GTU68_056392 [Idotea baltica]|nr:hypothetical protein [Idotea baltica]